MVHCPYCGSTDVMELRWCKINAIYKLSCAPEDYTGELACNECCSTFRYKDSHEEACESQ